MSPTVNRMQHKKNCYHCGDKHSPADCKFRAAECCKCRKKGHTVRVCRSKPFVQEPHPPRKLTPHATHVVTKDLLDYSMYNLTGTSTIKLLKVTMTVDNEELVMEVDTGASVSIISEETYNYGHLWPDGKKPSLQESDITLHTYSGEQLAIKGTLKVDVQYKD